MKMDLQAGIVRILKQDGTTAGTGFVVTGDGHVATCAHVVESTGPGPGDTLRIVFHATGETRGATVEPAYWCASTAEDVAILRLEGPLPEEVSPLPLSSLLLQPPHGWLQMARYEGNDPWQIVDIDAGVSCGKDEALLAWATLEILNGGERGAAMAIYTSKISRLEDGFLSQAINSSRPNELPYSSQFFSKAEFCQRSGHSSQAQEADPRQAAVHPPESR